MKKSMLLYILGLSFSLYTQISYANTCEMAVQDLDIAGLKLGISAKTFLQQYPQAQHVILPVDNHQFKFENGVNQHLKNQGIHYVNHIGYEPEIDKISSYSLDFLDGPYASYETELDDFKSNILSAFKVPQTGWKKSGFHYRYQCDDYLIEIIQDHGAVKSAVGPTVNIFSQYSSHWNDVTK